MTDRTPKNRPEGPGSQAGSALDQLLDADRPEPGPGFDARFFERLADADADADALLDTLLDPVVGADHPAPRPDFDARFFAQLTATDDEAELDALLDPAVGADRPAPRPDFDRRVLAELASEPAPAPRAAGARILRFVRRPVRLVPLLAAAAALLLWVMTRSPGDPPPADQALLSHLELLQVYDEMEVLDGISDEETFELVAMLHTLDDDAEARP